jgi:hypothetical protein
MSLKLADNLCRHAYALFVGIDRGDISLDDESTKNQIEELILAINRFMDHFNWSDANRHYIFPEGEMFGKLHRAEFESHLLPSLKFYLINALATST